MDDSETKTQHKSDQDNKSEEKESEKSKKSQISDASKSGEQPATLEPAGLASKKKLVLKRKEKTLASKSEEKSVSEEEKEKEHKIKPEEEDKCDQEDEEEEDKCDYPDAPRLIRDRGVGCKYIFNNQICTWTGKCWACEHGRRRRSCIDCGTGHLSSSSSSS